MKSLKKKLFALSLASLCFTGTMMVPAEVEAASTAEKLLYGAAAMLFISNYYSRMDDHSQLALLSKCQQQTGVYASANADNRVQDIYQNICDTGAVKRSYKVYVAPD